MNRIKLKNTIVDHERVRFNDQYIEAIAVYDVTDGKIVRVRFRQ